jgi:hypothetical protein
MLKGVVSAVFFALGPLVVLLTYITETWPPEESSQYFPKSALKALGNNKFTFDNSPVHGAVLNVLGFGTIFAPFEDSSFQMYIPLMMRLTLGLALLVSTFLFGKIFISNQIVNALFSSSVAFSFVSLSSVSYASKSLGVVFFLMTFVLLHKYSRESEKGLRIFTAAVLLTIFCLGMISNLAVTVVSLCAIPLFALFRKHLVENVSVSSIKIYAAGSLLTLVFPLYRYYFNDEATSFYLKAAQNTDLFIGSNWYALLGDGMRLQFGKAGEDLLYFPWIPEEQSIFYKVRLSILICILLILYLQQFSIVSKHNKFTNTSYRIVRQQTPQILKQISWLVIILIFVVIVPFGMTPFVNQLFEIELLRAFRDPWTKLAFFLVLFLNLWIFIRFDHLLKNQMGRKWESHRYGSKPRIVSQKRKLNLVESVSKRNENRKVMIKGIMFVLIVFHSCAYPVTVVLTSVSEGANQISEDRALNQHKIKKLLTEVRSVREYLEDNAKVSDAKSNQPALCYFFDDYIGYVNYGFSLLRVSLLSGHSMYSTVSVQDRFVQCDRYSPKGIDFRLDRECTLIMNSARFAAVVPRKCFA